MMTSFLMMIQIKTLVIKMKWSRKTSLRKKDRILEEHIILVHLQIRHKQQRLKKWTSSSSSKPTSFIFLTKKKKQLQYNLEDTNWDNNTGLCCCETNAKKKHKTSKTRRWSCNQARENLRRDWKNKKKQREIF